MDSELVEAMLVRDWGAFTKQVKRLGLGRPIRHGTRIALTVGQSVWRAGGEVSRCPVL